MTTNPKSEPSEGQAPAPTAIRFASLILVCLTIIALGQWHTSRNAESWFVEIGSFIPIRYGPT